MARRVEHWIGCCLLAAGCNQQAFEDVELHRGRTWNAVSRCIPDPGKVDVLLVVDDSASMAEEAHALAEALQSFGQIYDGDEMSLDYRIGVISTHVSRPGCDSGPDGALQTRSCLEHLADFAVTASHESSPRDVSAACEEACSAGSIDFRPTSLFEGDAAKPRPWIQREAGVHNLAPEQGVPEALACLGSLGVGGCERESPVAAVAAALRRFSDPSDPSYGFLRDEAGLAIVFIGDEDDCSMPPGAPELTGPGTPSAQCWNAAAVCDEDGCYARDGELWDLDELRGMLRAVEGRKQRVTGRSEQRVFVSAVAGVPPGWPTFDQVFDADGSAFANAFGVGPGCEEEGRRATPVVRLRGLVGGFSPWRSDLTSSCAGGWEQALACLPNGWPAFIPPLCLEVPDSIVDRGDLDPAAQCIATETRGGETVALPLCARVCDGPDCEASKWSLPAGIEACVAWESEHGPGGLADVDAGCLEDGHPAQARILRSTQPKTGRCTSVTCSYTE